MIHDVCPCYGLIYVSVSVIVDVVVRNVYYKYLHPKEALVSDGVLNRFVHVFIGDFPHWGPTITS